MPCYRPSRSKRPSSSSGPQDTRWQPTQDDFELLLDMLFHARIICFPTKEERVEMATRLNVTERQVQVWCQNKRQKLRESGIGYSDERAPALVIAERGKLAPAHMSASPVALAPVPIAPRPAKMSPLRKARAASEETESGVDDDAEYVPRSTRTRPYAVPRTRLISPIELIRGMSVTPVHSASNTPPPPRRLDSIRHHSPIQSRYLSSPLPELAFDDEDDSVTSELDSPPPEKRSLPVPETKAAETRVEKAPSWVWELDTQPVSSWSFQDRLATWAQNRFPEADLRSGSPSGVKRVW